MRNRTQSSAESCLPRHCCLFGFVHLAGDSLSKEMTDTLAAILRAEVLDVNPLMFRHYVGCQGNFKFSFLRNDFLDTRTTTFPEDYCEPPEVFSSQCTVFAGKIDVLSVCMAFKMRHSLTFASIKSFFFRQQIR